MQYIQRFARNTMGFNPVVDRLFCVGDLVDRGPDSDAVLEWLDKPWFYSVKGNHEELTIEWAQQQLHDVDEVAGYMRNGGVWNFLNPFDAQQDLAEAFKALPVAIEVKVGEDNDKPLKVGIVHADFLGSDWDAHWRDVQEGLRIVHEPAFLWGRTRIKLNIKTPVVGVQWLFCGHTPVQEVKALGNVVYIDTGAWQYHERNGGKPFAILPIDAPL